MSQLQLLQGGPSALKGALCCFCDGVLPAVVRAALLLRQHRLPHPPTATEQGEGPTGHLSAGGHQHGVHLLLHAQCLHWSGGVVHQGVPPYRVCLLQQVDLSLHDMCGFHLSQQCFGPAHLLFLQLFIQENPQKRS